MPWWRVWNESQIPISIAISWSGWAQYCVNNLTPGAYWECYVTGLGWHDLSAMCPPANFVVGDTIYDAMTVGKPDFLDLQPWNTTIVTFDADDNPSIAVPWVTASQETLDSLVERARRTGQRHISTSDCGRFWKTWGIIHPVQAANFYGPDGYNIHFRGTQFSATLNLKSDFSPYLDLTRAIPLYAAYTNNASQKQYVTYGIDAGDGPGEGRGHTIEGDTVPTFYY